jgi:hypothetical protein
MPPAIHNKMTVSAVVGIFGAREVQELKKLANGMVVAEAARLAAVIFLIKSLRGLCVSMTVTQLIN